MPRFETLEREKPFKAKFARVGDIFIATQNQDFKTLHSRIVDDESLWQEFVFLRQTNPHQVDGGFISIVPSGKVQLHGDSGTLAVPLTKVARILSAVTLEKQNPDLRVEDVFKHEIMLYKVEDQPIRDYTKFIEV